MQKALLYIFIIVALIACGPADDDADIYTPKPAGYFRLQLPKTTYTQYSSNCPFTFEYSSAAKVGADSSRTAQPCWLNIDYPVLQARIYLSYKPINKNLPTMLEDARNLVYKHTVKADDIKERIFGNPDKKVYGNMYEIGGDAASSVQFYATDSTNHFLRGALYFNCPPNADSLAPVISYVKQDITHLMETLAWK